MTDGDIKRISTGISGLDELCEGGFADGSVNLVSGPAGSAKSLMGTHFILDGAKKDEPSLYVTIEESKESLFKAGRRFNMNLEEYEKKGLIYFMDMTSIRAMSSQEEETTMDLLRCSTVRKLIDQHLSESNVKRLCLDSLTALGLAYKNLEELRSDLFRLATDLRNRGLTSLLLTETLEDGQLTRFGVEQFITDSFIVLGLERIQGELRRTISVRKMRHTRQESSIHPFIIMSNGIVVAADEKVV